MIKKDNKPIKFNIKLLVVIILMSLILSLFFLLKLPNETLFHREINNTGHTVLFAVLSLLGLKCHRLLFPKKLDYHAYINVFILLIVIGFGIELIQIKTARDADAIDLLRDFLGIISLFGIDYFLRKKNIREITRKELAIISITLFSIVISLIPISTLTIAYYLRNNAFPTVINFNSYFYKYFYITYNTKIDSVIPNHIENNISQNYSLVEFSKAKLTGISIIEPMPNWQGYDSVCFKIYSSNNENFKLSLRINDKTHNYSQNDRFNSIFNVSPTIVKHCFKLSIIENAPKNRQMDLKHITNMQIFKSHNPKKIKFYISNIWLD